MKQEMRTIWARLGIFIHATQAEMDELVQDNSQSHGATLAKIFSEGRVEIEGDSYVPESVIAEYNLKHGTAYYGEDAELDTSQLNGKWIRVVSPHSENKEN